MESHYHIDDTHEIITPALIVFRDLVERNIVRMIEMAGDLSRLRPHCKTHKMREVIRLLLERGVTKHKCATFAEAEMLAQTGVKDVLLAYHIVGANIARAVKFVQQYPEVKLAVLADDSNQIAALGQAMAQAGQSIHLLLDLDMGLHRTGVAPGERARQLYGQIVQAAGLEPGGLHVYDGHQHQQALADRSTAVHAAWEGVAALRGQLAAAGWPVPTIVAGGTPTFPVYAKMDDPAVEFSPGTCIFFDMYYRQRCPELPFTPAALLLTRVISRPAPDRVTFDLGYKAIASDPPADTRLVFPDLPDAELLLQNEEHLVVRTDQAKRFAPGDELLAIPWHVCPSCALHKQAYIVSGGKLADRWTVAARDRWLTI